jgi:hypothetical protein
MDRRMRSSLEILGVYRVARTESLLRRMLTAHWGGRATPARRKLAMPRVEAELRGLVLVEAIVSRPCVQRLEYATQTAGVQVPWQVTLLESDGESVVRRLFLDEPDSSPARVAFFLHRFTPSSPLFGPGCRVELPRPRRMPARLASLFQYQPVD